MGRIVRYEFLGSRFWFWLRFVSGIGLPLAILHLVDATVRVEDELEDPSAVLAEFGAERLPSADVRGEIGRVRPAIPAGRRESDRVVGS